MLLFTLLTGINAPLHCNQTDLKQRQLAITEFIQQELRKGTSLEDISRKLLRLSKKSSEYLNWLNAHNIYNQIQETATKDGCYSSESDEWGTQLYPFSDKKECEQIKKDYMEASHLDSTLRGLYFNSPEYKAGWKVARLAEIEKHKNSLLQKEKSVTEEKMRPLIQEQENIEDELGLSAETD